MRGGEVQRALLLRVVCVRQAEDILLVLGGTIPDEDQPRLKESGVSAIFGPGTPLETTITFIRENVKPRTLAL